MNADRSFPLCFLFVCACGDAGSETDSPTFQADVKPVVAEHCSSCHSPGGIAPLSLLTYDQVKAFGPQVKRATAERSMPPFLADNSGACATYHDANWLTDDEIDLIGRWVDEGMPEGGASDAIVPPAPVALDDATHTSSMAAEYMPDATLSDDYRCFLFDDDFEGEQVGYLTDFEVVPGDKRVVHHVVIYQPRDQAGVDQALALDTADAPPGYPCFGASGVTSARMVMNWAPGGGVVRHPASTGVPLDPRFPLLVQMHYNLAAGAYPDRTAVRMKIVPQVKHPMIPWFYTDGTLSLPPGNPAVEKVIDTPFSLARLLSGQTGSGPLSIMGVRAHMHTLGKSMRIERASAAGEMACLVDIANYSFHWQRSYFLEQPVSLANDDQLRVRCGFDTTSRDTTTTWGEGTQDEMCLATIYTIEGAYAPE